MGRGLAFRPPACAEHPHRAAEDACDACARWLCRECIQRGTQLLCPRCAEAIPALEAQHLVRQPLVARLRLLAAENKASVVAGSVITVVLMLLALSAMTQVAGGTWRKEVGAVVGRVAQVDQLLAEFGSEGSALALPVAPTGPPTTIPSFLLGLPASATGPAGPGIPPIPLGVDPGALTDGQLGGRVPAWRTPAGRVTAELRYLTPLRSVGRVIFGHSEALPRESWAREVEVWIATDAAEPETVLVGRWELAPTTVEQSFAFPPVLMRSVRLRVLSNYGSLEYTSLAEFALVGG